MKFVVKSKKVLTGGALKNASVLIDNGKIADVFEYEKKTDWITEDFGELVLMPGLTDTHVHINEPGRTDWEGFETATKAAVAGGITMLVDMPLNSSPVTTTFDSFDQKIQSAENKLYADSGFYGGLIPGNAEKLEPLIKRGVLGLKAFMIDSGIEEFPFVNEYDLRRALSTAALRNAPELPVLVHAETDCGFIRPDNYSPNSFRSFLDTRPAEWEHEAVKFLTKLCREFRHHIHIVHLSSAGSLEMIREAKSEGLPLTVETCPHYLYFSSEDIPDNDTRFKCTPPIRDSINREKLWEAVIDGTIDFIVSDHSPCDPGLKFMPEANFEKAWGGIAGLQFSLPVFWTAAKERKISIKKVSELMSRRTAEFLGLGKKKGKIEKGFDADIVVFDPDKKFTVEDKNIFHRHKTTPYSGRDLFGVTETVYLRGKKVFDKGKIVSAAVGEIVLKNKFY